MQSNCPKTTLSKLKPPWSSSTTNKAWCALRPPEASLTDLADPKNAKTVQKLQKDHKLKNWDKWLAVRKDLHKQFQASSGREPCNLVMNSEQYERSKQENKEIIEYAEKLTIPDKVRGGLDFWGFPTEIGKECPGQGLNLLAQQKQLEKGVLPKITKSGIPKLIKIEKDIPDEGRIMTKKNFENSKYKMQRERVLKPKIDKILPHTPDIDKLIVVGETPKPQKYEPYIQIPPITINLDTNYSERPTLPLETLDENIIGLRINKTIILKEAPGKTASNLRYLMGEFYNEKGGLGLLSFTTKSFRKITKSITLQNMGTLAIQYAWRQVDTTVPYMNKKPLNPVFFFDKTEGVLIPGEEKIVYFWYFTSFPQINKELWHLTIYPNIMDCVSDCRCKSLTLTLAGITTIEPFSIVKTKSYVNRKVALNVVQDILNYLLSSFTKEKLRIISYEDLAKDDFLFSIKNPNYYYHQLSVDKLKAMYQRLPLENFGREWDLSIKTLRNLIIQIDLPEQNDFYLEFQEILQLLLKPDFKLTFDNKHMAVYMLLSKFFNVFEQEYSKSKKIMSASIMAVNSTHVGDDLHQFISRKSLPIISGAVSKYSFIHSNQISHRLYGLSQQNFDKTVFRRRILRHLQLTIRNIDATLASLNQGDANK